MLDLSICIVNWNVEALLRQCLRAIFDNTKGVNLEVIVVDNNSKDESVRMVEKEFPQVKLIANHFNAGFTKANNQAIMMAKGRYLLILNPDTEVIDNALKKMIQFMDSKHDCAALGPKLLNTDGSLQRSCRIFPTLETMFYSALFLDQLLPGSTTFGKYFMTWWNFDSVREVDQPMGSALMVRKTALDKVGAFDENIFIWFDEVDLCYRIKKAGGKIFFTPDAKIKHHLSRSFQQWKSMPQMIRGTFIWRKSRNYFFRKHYDVLSVLMLWLFDLLQVSLIIGVISLIFTTIAKVVAPHNKLWGI